MPTTCPDLHCVFEYLDSQTQVTTLGELTAIPEMDGWIYAGGNYSMVCSVFAFHGWKNAFGDFWPSPVEVRCDRVAVCVAMSGLGWLICPSRRLGSKRPRTTT